MVVLVILTAVALLGVVGLMVANTIVESKLKKLQDENERIRKEKAVREETREKLKQEVLMEEEFKDYKNEKTNKAELEM